MHPDTALIYRGVRVWHTLRDLAGGRQNATYTDNWLTWKFTRRDSDEGGPGQFDIRDLAEADDGYQPAQEPTYLSPLLPKWAAHNLMACIDDRLARQRASRSSR